MTLGESVKSPPAPAERPAPPPLPPRRSKGLAWAKLLLAPLLGLSVLAHLLLLFTPLPSRPAPEVEDEAAEEEFVDLLSISSLTAPESEPELELPNPPPPTEAVPPPAQATAPSAPTQPIVPEAFPDTPPPAATVSEAAPLADTPEPTPPPAADFVQPEEAMAIITRLTRGAGSDFDITDTEFPSSAYTIRRGIGAWSPQEQGCFFAQISAENYQLLPSAVSVRFLARNIGLIQQEDLPRTFPAPEHQINAVDGGYCGRPLFQILRQGQPYIFLSIIGIGLGDPESTGLVMIWASDPRG